MIQYSQWLSIPLSTRMKIAEALGIKKLRSTHVANDQVLDDGYNVKDVEEAIKVIPMQNYLNSAETDITILFKNLIDKVEGRKVEVTEVDNKIVAVNDVPVEEIVKPIKKRGRPFKNK